MSLKNLFSSAGGASSDVLETEVISTASIRDVFGDNSCVALYRFEGDATDTSGNFNGTASNVTYGAGKFGQCGVFSGSSSYIRLTNMLNILMLQPYTISFHLRVSQFPVGADGNYDDFILYAQDNNNSHNSLIGVYILRNTQNLRIHSRTNNSNYVELSTQNIPLNTFIHVAIVQDTSNLYVFLDGVISAESAISTTFTTTADADLCIGAVLQEFVSQTPSKNFNGSIDQFRIFNRALTAEEVAALYVEEKTVVKETVRELKDLVDPFLDKSGVALYKMDGNAQDAGGLYNGTPTNMSYTSGKFGDCAVFNGSTSYISIPAIISNIEYISFSMWIKFNNSNEHVFFDTQLWSTTSGIGFYKNTSNKLNLFFKQASTSAGILTTNTVPIGSTFHLVVIKSQGRLSVYIDNVLFETTSITNLTSITPQSGTIGRQYSPAISYLDGSIDQFRIFNRALTAEDVAMLYEEREDLTLGKDTQHLIDPFGDKSGVALYEFNGDAKDTGGAFNGTASNVTYGAGKFGQCGVFNGTNSVVNIPNNIYNRISVSTYVKVDVAANKIFCQSYGAEFNDYGGWSVGVNSDLKFWGRVNTTSALSTNIVGTTIISLGVFYHVVLSYDGTNINLYVNGQLDATVPLVGSIRTPSAVYSYLGCSKTWSGAAMVYFAGSIDQVRIFNRALTAEEVAVLYTEKKPQVSTINLTDPFGDNSAVALYKMDGNALDAGGSYNGTASGVTYEEGKLGHCAVFNGTSANINTGYNYGSLFALSVWIKTTSSGWVANSYTSDTAGGGLTVESNVAKLEFGGGGGVIRNLYGTKVVNDGAWHHVVALSNGTTGTIYVDGVLDVSSPFVHYNSSGNIYLGKRGTIANYFSGRMDQVRFFKRMLSQEEVEILYNEKPNDTTEDGLVAYYPLQVSAQDAQSTFEGTATGVTFDGDSAYFNGTSSQISIPSIVSKFNTQSIFGVSLWFKGTQTSVPVGLFSVRNLASDSIVLLLALNRTVAGDIGLDSSAAGAFLTLGTYNGGFNNGIWHHCYVDINFTNKTFNIFVDGKLVSSGTNASLVKSTGASYAYIGCNYLSQYFAGNLDEVRVYERTLTAQEVSDLYNNGRHIEESLLPSIPQTSLVAHFPLDINATDVVGAFDGVPTGVTFDGDSAYFGSSGSYIKVLSSPISSNIWSVCFWIKPSSNHNKAIFDFSSGRTAFMLNGNDVFSFYDGNYVEFTYAPPLNVFTQVSLVFEGTSLKLYVNGVLHSSKTIAGVIPSGFMTLGSFYDYTYGLTGNLDEFRVYKRALTAQEVSDIYNYGR